MPRAVLLFTEPWTDLPLEELVARASDWGYQGLEFACWGDHLEVQRGISETDYCSARLDLLARHGLQVPVVNNHRVGQAVSDAIDIRHQSLLPDYVWGDGQPPGVQQRAAEEIIATIRVAQKLGAAIVAGYGGSLLASYAAAWPAPTNETISNAFHTFAAQWGPILDTCQEAGVRFALQVQPGQIAYDLYTAEMLLDVLEGREEFGFVFDPCHLHWQGVDPVEFLLRFPDRIFHVHVGDISLRLNGRTSLLNSNTSPGDPRRGWDFRAPGRGGLDWEGIIRGLNSISYAGNLSVNWQDSGMNRDTGAEEACKFVKHLDFERPHPQQTDAFA